MTISSVAWVLGVLLLLAGAVFYMTDMPSDSYAGTLPPLTAEEAALRDHLEQHVTMLAGEIGERNIWSYPALGAAADYIERTLRGLGYAVTQQLYTSHDKTVRNLEAEIKGSKNPNEIVLIGAHYDSVRGSPGANDNASSVAALLEIARLMAGNALARTVRFVAFSNEEPPFFYTQQMGSRVYARRARGRGDNLTAMIALETIGYYDTTKGSQHYPNPIYSMLYPDTADFVAFVGNLSSRRLVQRCLGSFRRDTDFPSEGIAAPGWLTGVHWSDHWSFWQEGYPALMVTDTAPYRYTHYHAGTDTPDKIDYPRLARLTAGLARVTEDLAR